MPSLLDEGRSNSGSNAGGRDIERVAALLGAAATLLALGGIALAVSLDPTFSWTTDALSDLGVRDRSAPAFNWGLIGGGAVGVCYAASLALAGTEAHVDGAPGRVGRAVRTTLLALTMVAMAGVGRFDLTEPLHGPAAIGFYGLITLVFAVDGVLRRAEATGRAALGFAVSHVAVWATFAAGWWPVTGLALPELPGALMLAAWVWVIGPAPVVAAVRDRERASQGPTDEH